MFRKPQSIFPLNVDLNASGSESAKPLAQEQDPPKQEGGLNVVSIPEDGVELRFRRRDSSGIKRDSETYGSGLTAGDKSPANLFVGPGLTLKGDIGACNRVDVQGSIDATVEAHELYIAKGGKVVGTVEVDRALIEGSFEGTLIVNGCLHINQTGHAAGSISYREIDVEKGGRMIGDIHMAAVPEVAADSEQVVALDATGTDSVSVTDAAPSDDATESTERKAGETPNTPAMGQAVFPRIEEDRNEQSAVN